MRCLRVASTLFLSFAFGSAADSQTALQINPECSIQNVVAPSGTLRLENVTINCGKGADPRTALKVNYFWLDAFSAAQLLAGQNDQRLRDLLGPRPIVLSNEVTEAFDELQKRFGTNIGSHSLFLDYYDHIVTHVDGSRGSKREYKLPASTYRAKRSQSIRVFDGMSPIYWPDVEAVRTMITTSDFPKSYKHYVKGIDDYEADFEPIIRSPRALSKDDTYAIMNLALNSRIFYRPTTLPDFSSYRDSLADMRDAALASNLNIDFPAGTGPDIPEREMPPDEKDFEKWEREQQLERIKRLTDLARNKTVSAVQFVAREGMPDDFVTAYGFSETHTGDGPITWGIVALPRRLYLQIAVIENTAKTPTDYSLSDFIVLRDRDTKLRPPNQNSLSDERSIPFIQRRLAHHERVVIPLSIEFREHRKVGDEDRQEELKPSTKAFELIRLGLSRISDTLVEGRDFEGRLTKVLPPKPKALFQTNEPQSVEPVYLYGPRYTLKSVKIQDMQIPIRAAATAGVYKVAGFMGGSCPVLYYRTYGSPEWYKVGNVLRLAMGKARAATETYRLPKDVAEIVLAEQEPERTYISSLTVAAHHESSGRSRKLVEAGNAFTLDAEELWSAIVTPVNENETVTVTVSGYYVPYSIALGERRHH